MQAGENKPPFEKPLSEVSFFQLLIYMNMESEKVLLGYQIQAAVIKGNTSLPARRKVNVMPMSWKETQISNARE